MPSSAGRWLRAHEQVLLGAAGIVTVIAAWELAVRAELIDAVLVASPSRIYEAGRTEIENGRIWKYIQVSLSEFAAGFGIAALLGTATGFLGGWFRAARQIVQPWVSLLYALPHVALVPLIILWMGIGFSSKVFVVAVFAVFPFVINTMVGVRQAEGRFLDVARSFGASEARVLRTVVLPGALPFILTGARLGAGRALVGVVVAELIAANEGLGFLISIAGSTLNTPLLMFSVVLIGVFGVLLSELMKRVEERFDRWRPEGA